MRLARMNNAGRGIAGRFVLNRPADTRGLPKLPVVSRGSRIPKIIHQTGPDRPYPDAIEQNILNLKRLNPDWSYRFYSHDDRRSYIERHYGPDITSLYDSINPIYGAASADLFRYLLLYKEGGVYLDLKSGSNRPLSSILDLDACYYLSQWPNRRGDQYDHFGLHPDLEDFGGEEFQQWNVICSPGHEFLLNVILTVLRNLQVYNPIWHHTGAKGVLCVTGPIPYTTAIYPLLSSYPHKLCNMSDIGIFYSVYDDGMTGNYAHAGPSHYSKLAGQPIVLTGPLTYLLYRCKRRWGHVRSLVRFGE